MFNTIRYSRTCINLNKCQWNVKITLILSEKLKIKDLQILTTYLYINSKQITKTGVF